MADSDAAGGLLVLICCCALPCLCAFVAATIAFLVFGIIFLVEDEDVCSYRSPLWIWGVSALSISLIVSVLGPYMAPRTNPEAMAAAQAEQAVTALWGGGSLAALPSFISLTALTIAGFIVVYGGYTCSDMKSAGLYTWSLVALGWYSCIIFCLCNGLFFISDYYKVRSHLIHHHYQY